MVVTAVEPRRKSFSALYIDGEFAMKLDTETLLANPSISPSLYTLIVYVTISPGFTATGFLLWL